MPLYHRQLPVDKVLWSYCISHMLENHLIAALHSFMTKLSYQSWQVHVAGMVCCSVMVMDSVIFKASSFGEQENTNLTRVGG